MEIPLDCVSRDSNTALSNLRSTPCVEDVRIELQFVPELMPLAQVLSGNCFGYQTDLWAGYRKVASCHSEHLTGIVHSFAGTEMQM